MSDEWVKFVLNEKGERVLTRCTKEEADGVICLHEPAHGMDLGTNPKGLPGPSNDAAWGRVTPADLIQPTFIVKDTWVTYGPHKWYHARP